MTTQLFWVAFGATLVALFAIRAFIEASAQLNWYKSHFKRVSDFKSPPPPSKWMVVFSKLLFLPKL